MALVTVREKLPEALIVFVDTAAQVQGDRFVLINTSQVPAVPFVPVMIRFAPEAVTPVRVGDVGGVV